MGRTQKKNVPKKIVAGKTAKIRIYQHESSSDHNEETKSSFLSECEHTFATTNFYSILNLEKDKATANDIKRAYYKLSLKYHPDKIVDESKKELAKEKFQILGKIYGILSDNEKKKIYDETGFVDGEDEFFGTDIKNWEVHWRNMFNKVTTEDVDKFFEKYKNSDEEKNDLLKFYIKHEGNMDLILEEMLCYDSIEEEPRFKKIITEAIDKCEVEKFDKFIKDGKKKALKRKTKFELEAVEAEKIRKEIGIDQNQDSLRKAILARREKESISFIDKLAKKYSKNGNSPNKETESEESESDPEYEQETSITHKNKKKSPIIRKNIIVKTNKANKGKAIQKKVKRL